MNINFTSTQVLQSIPQQTVAQLQNQLTQAEVELASGRHADIGIELGFLSSNSVNLRLEQTRLSTIQDTNNLLAGRLEATQLALQSIVASSEELFDALLGARDSQTGPEVIAEVGRHSLEALTSQLNQQFAGEFLFAGINSADAPFESFFAQPPPASKTALDASFLAQFGFSQNDPASASITAAQISNYIDGAYSDLFADPQWGNIWSNAADDLRDVRIGPDTIVEAGFSANEPAIRDLVHATTLVAGLGIENLNEPAFDAVVNDAIKIARRGLDALAVGQATLGLTQARITNENQRLDIRVDLISQQLADLEEVDPFETATRANTLLTQIETSFALTARIQQLSLLRFL